MSRYCLGLLLLYSLRPAEGAQLFASDLTIQPGAAATVSIRYSAQGANISALQFELVSDAALEVSASLGEAAVSAGKVLSSALASATYTRGPLLRRTLTRRIRFLITGMNQTALGDGSVVSLVLKPASAVPATYVLMLQYGYASAPDGTPVPLALRNGQLKVVASKGRRDFREARMLAQKAQKSRFCVVTEPVPPQPRIGRAPVTDSEEVA